MERKEYSAGMVKLSFWFFEFRKVLHLLNSGKTLDEIKALNLAENIFAAPTKARAIQIFNTVSNRVRGLNPSFYQVFESGDLATQKLINLIAIMQSDSLLFAFVYEVYREKLIIGSNEFADSDIRVFFNDKQLQSERIAKWTDYTLKNLGSCYKTMLMEAGITDHSVGKRKILKPIIDQTLTECLKKNDMELFIHALTGVR